MTGFSPSHRCQAQPLRFAPAVTCAPSSNRLRCTLRAVGLLLVLGTVLYWTAAGRKGWSQTKVPVQKIDPITEIPYVDYEHRFAPGIDFLAAGTALGLVIAGSSLFVRKTQPTTPSASLASS